MNTRIDGAVRAHQQTVQDSFADMTTFLRTELGVQLTALLADVDARTITRWGSGEVEPRDQGEKRIRAAYQVFRLLEADEASPTIRAWFMGMNPQLDDLSPAEAIAQDRYREVLSAARAFSTGG